MKKAEQYRQTLKTLEDWDAFLLKESGLPGPRGNLELAQAVADEGHEEQFRRWLRYDAAIAPVNSPSEFLPFCGVVGLGRLLAEGKIEVWETLRHCASDPRWRMREGVALALQRLGEKDMASLLQAMEQWGRGSPLEQRAAAAALCEPKLLVEAGQIKKVLQILDEITASLASADERKSEAFKVLKKGLAYCWSVAVAALPEEGKQKMEKWLASDDKDVTWIMQQNLKKHCLARMDAAWVEKWQRA
ncbi:MAG TPA: hypothetical protein VEC93_00415 [Anaerolineae bacterium]|nr:hypothetical protein [Anaerolineae bacterium]